MLRKRKFLTDNKPSTSKSNSQVTSHNRRLSSSDHEEEHEGETNALSAALSLRKKRRDLEHKAPVKKKSKADTNGDELNRPQQLLLQELPHQAQRRPEDRSEVGAVYGRFLPASSSSLKETEDENKNDSSKNNTSMLGKAPASLPKRPQSPVNLGPGSSQSEQTGPTNERNRGEGARPVYTKPKGLLSTDEEVKGFAVSGRIVEVDLRPGKINPVQNEEAVVSILAKNKQPGSEASKQEEIEAEKRAAAKRKEEEIIDQSVESILKSAAFPYFTPLQSRPNRVESNTVTSTVVAPVATAPANTSSGPEAGASTSLGDDDQRRRRRIEQARKMHEDIERAMRLRDQRPGGGMRRGNVVNGRPSRGGGGSGSRGCSSRGASSGARTRGRQTTTRGTKRR